jgi:endogenous inhibitor of DNA gyrase (YacG/DUF329 family)
VSLKKGAKTMTLLFECPNCQFQCDKNIETNKIIPVVCPQCEFAYYIELKLWKQGDKYYGNKNGKM